MVTLDDLKQRIAVVRQKERKVIMLAGLSRLLVTLIAVVLCYFLLDWLIDLPYLARLAGVALGFGVLGFTAKKHLLRELSKIADDDEIALRIEARNHDLRGRLISTLQLSRASQNGEFHGSSDLFTALEEETLRMSEPLDFLRIINTETLKKFAMLAGLVVAIKLVLLFSFPGYFKALGERLLHADAQFPTRTRILEVKLPPLTARGDDVTVQVLVDKTSALPEEPGALYFQSVSGNRVSVELASTDAAKGIYSGTLTRITEDNDVVAKLGDAHTKSFHINVLSRPEVEINASTITYRLPQYARSSEKKIALQKQLKDLNASGATQDKQKELEEAINRESGVSDPPPDKFGGISVLTGSNAEFTLAATKSLREAQVERSDGQVFKFEKADDKGVLWRLARFPVDCSGSFHVTLVDTDGLKNCQPAVEYPVDAKLDQPPTIKMTRPTHDITVVNNARIPIGFTAHDDYGLRCIWIVYRLQPEGQSNPNAEVNRIELKDMPHLREMPEKTFVWDVSSLKVKPGDQLTYWMEADDACPVNNTITHAAPRHEGEQAPAPAPADPQAKTYARSADLKLIIVSREDKIAELQAEVERLMKQISDAGDTQKHLKDDVLNIMDAISKLKQK